jgi:hypothetical protein
MYFGILLLARVGEHLTAHYAKPLGKYLKYFSCILMVKN